MNYPKSIAEAKRLNKAIALVFNDPCPFCHSKNRKVYIDGTCQSCLIKRINATYDYRTAKMLTTSEGAAQGLEYVRRYTPCENGPHEFLQMTDKNARCWTCMTQGGRHISNPRVAARESGKTWYTPITNCKKCGTLAMRRTVDDRCSQCEPLKNERSAARAAARKTESYRYMPELPCPDCGQHVERITQTNVCTGCRELRKQQPDNELKQLRLLRSCVAPCMSATAARAAGFSYYTDDDGTIRISSTGLPI